MYIYICIFLPIVVFNSSSFWKLIEMLLGLDVECRFSLERAGGVGYDGEESVCYR